jgi:hypothetical protein
MQKLVTLRHNGLWIAGIHPLVQILDSNPHLKRIWRWLPTWLSGAEETDS